MIQHYLSTFLLFFGIVISIIGWIFSFNLIILGYALIFISPFILDKEYEYKIWKNEYLKN